MKKTKVYLGCDLFTEGQRWQAKEIQYQLNQIFSGNIDIYNPAENLDINDKSAGFASGYDILKADYQRLKESDILIALCDTMDDGLMAEMGIAFERDIPVFQLHTDIRLGGNDKQDKLDALKEDVFNNDFMYKNKLVTALSYGDKHGRLYDTPRVYKTKEDLCNAVAVYIMKEGV